MSDIIGTIVKIKDFLENKETEINVWFDNKEAKLFSLKKDRIYRVPEFQREIRWDAQNITELINDISNGKKFLGNIILASRKNNTFEIIDGQQRITNLIMILQAVRLKYGKNISVFKTCKLINANFVKLEVLIDNYFNELHLGKELLDQILSTDFYHQFDSYKELWKVISESEVISNLSKCKFFLKNLEGSELNLLLSKNESSNSIIECFMDINLKGVKLDTEDIFKAHLFSQDGSGEIQNEWNKLKHQVYNSKKYKIDYQIMKIIEHYFYCDLYKNDEYENLIFNEKFLVKKDVIINNISHKKGTHILNIIINEQYLKDTMTNINNIVEVMIDLAKTDGLSIKLKDLLENVDNDEKNIINNLAKKIILDKDLAPKILLIKYIKELLNETEKARIKEKSKDIYAISMASVLFVVFEDKKSGDRFYDIVSSPDWYEKLIEFIISYTRNRIQLEKTIEARYNYSTKKDEYDEQYRCKSLATLHNFMRISGKRAKPTSIPLLKEYINSSEKYSIEHFFVNKSGKICVNKKDKLNLTYDSDIKKYKNSLFNYIFINKDLNSKFENMWVIDKLNLIDLDNDIDCDYS